MLPLWGLLNRHLQRRGGVARTRAEDRSAVGAMLGSSATRASRVIVRRPDPGPVRFRHFHRTCGTTLETDEHSIILERLGQTDHRGRRERHRIQAAGVEQLQRRSLSRARGVMHTVIAL